MLKVNLGSGIKIIEGWINIDKSWNIYLSKFPTLKKMLYKFGLISKATFQANWNGKNIIRRDITKKLFFEDDSIDFIYCSHVFEHLTRDDARKVCEEAYRTLKKQGICRVVVPDLKLFAQKYVQHNESFFGTSQKPIADVFWESLHFKGRCKPRLIENIFFNCHKYMYDAESLAFLLKSVGFQDIQECKFRQGKCLDLEKIEHRTRSVYIEARK